MAKFGTTYLIARFVKQPFTAFQQGSMHAENGCLFSKDTMLCKTTVYIDSNETERINFISLRWLPPKASSVSQNRLNILHATGQPFVLLPSFDTTREETVASYKEVPDPINERMALAYFDRICAPEAHVLTPAEASAALFVPGRPLRPLQPVPSVVRSDGMHVTHSTHEGVVKAFADKPLAYARFDTMFTRPAQQTKSTPRSVLFMTRRLRIALYDPQLDKYYRLVEHYDSFYQTILDMLAKTLPLHKTIPLPFLTEDYELHNHEQNILHFTNRIKSAKAFFESTQMLRAFQAYKRNNAAITLYCRQFGIPLDMISSYEPYSPQEVESIRRILLHPN